MPAAAEDSDGWSDDPDAGYVDTRSPARQWVEYVLLAMCQVAWCIDASLLPLFFKEFQELFEVTQTALGMLTTAKGWTAAAFALPCGFFGELLPRPVLIGVGMVFWACGLGLCSCAVSFRMLFLGRVLNGMGLGIVQPLLMSLVADKSPPTRRGSAFGTLFFVGSVCNTLFSYAATRYAVATVFGVAGWRVSIASVALFSACVGVAVLMIVVEPNAELIAQRVHKGAKSVFVENMPKVFQLFSYPTFIMILLQGAPGTAPWVVFPFFTQWLELSCFDHHQTALIFSMFNWGGALSNLLVGMLLNCVSTRFPDHGPPTIANFSIAIGLPFLVLIYFILPKPAALGEGAGMVAPFCITFLAFGIGASMCGTINKKVFSDIVPASIFTYVFAIDQFIENSIGNLAGPAVGILANKVFHYDRTAINKGGCAPEEATKLGMGMFWVCNVSWVLCFAFYACIHCTYPTDRRRQLAIRRGQTQDSWGDCKGACGASSDQDSVDQFDTDSDGDSDVDNAQVEAPARRAAVPAAA